MMTNSPINVGPLEALLADPAVTEIHVDLQGVRCEKAGEMILTDVKFKSDHQRRQIIESIVAAGGVILSATQTSASCVLEDGTRVEARFEPLALSLYKRGKVMS